MATFVSIEPWKKELNKDKATSILANNELLKKSKLLKEVCSNRDNVYYHILGTNYVIMHVEAGFCILTDYKVMTIKGKMILPVMLSTLHYGVYQDNRGRDWVKSSEKRGDNNIGYDIKILIHGKASVDYCTDVLGYTLDHLGYTFDERECRKQFTLNLNDGSHRRKEEIIDDPDLERFIEKIKKNEI